MMLILSETYIYDKDTYCVDFLEKEGFDDMTFILLNKTNSNFVISSDSLSTKTIGNSVYSLRKIYSTLDNNIAIGIAGNNATSYYDINGNIDKIIYTGDIVDRYLSLYNENKYNEWCKIMCEEIYKYLPDNPNGCQFTQLLIVRKVNNKIKASYVYISKEKSRISNIAVYDLNDDITTFTIGNDWENYNKIHKNDSIPQSLDALIEYNRNIIQQFIDDKTIASIDGAVWTVYSELE